MLCDVVRLSELIKESDTQTRRHTRYHERDQRLIEWLVRAKSMLRNRVGSNKPRYIIASAVIALGLFLPLLLAHI